MWVKHEGKLAFLLPYNNGDVPFSWNKHRFESLREKAPRATVVIRKLNNALRAVKLEDLQFDSEAITERR